MKLGPPPKFWLPERPAIIRPADGKLLTPMVGMLLPVALPMLQGGETAFALSFVTFATDDTGAAFTLPNDIQAGDLIVVWDCATNAPVSAGPVPAAATPSGFTNDINVNNGLDARCMFSHKIAVGTEGGTSVNGMNATDGETKITAVFRGTKPITTATVSSTASQITDGNPTAQVVTSGSGVAPLIVFGLYGSGFGAPIDPRTFTPAKDNEQSILSAGSGFQESWLAYKIYNSAPADVTVDMDDELHVNELASCYIQCA